MRWISHFFIKLWYKPSWRYLAYLFFPFSLIFYIIVFIRKQCYQFGLFQIYSPPVPLCVVGNITVGGTGKTPLVIALAETLRARGLSVGIISRGMGRYSGKTPLEVLPEMDAHMAGDETVLLAKRKLGPVFIHKNRVLALQALLQKYACDCVISDDGLQHLALGRTQEIILIDGARGLGNRLLLPAGPLREPMSRLKNVKWILSRGGNIQNAILFHIKPIHFVSVLNPDKKMSLDFFSGKTAVAIAGIANPQLFFQQLMRLNINIETYSFPDHAEFKKEDFQKFKSSVILMTEKDAVKCQKFATEDFYYLQIAAELPELILNNLIDDLLRSYP